jgi:hypothetical protein
MLVVDQSETLEAVCLADALANQNMLSQDHTGAIKAGWNGIGTQGAAG